MQEEVSDFMSNGKPLPNFGVVTTDANNELARKIWVGPDFTRDARRKGRCLYGQAKSLCDGGQPNGRFILKFLDRRPQAWLK